MLNTSKIRNIYSKIQNQLFSMIPEKWSSIYLYASVIDKLNNIQAGEMFFYYYPSSILVKKKPVSVYEVPTKLNVSETAYMKLVKDLYETKKEDRYDVFEHLGAKKNHDLVVGIGAVIVIAGLATVAIVTRKNNA